MSNTRVTDEVEDLRKKYDELGLKVCQAFDSELEQDTTKKSLIREWASTLETLMRKTGMESEIHLITSYLMNHVRKNGMPITQEKYIFIALQEYPQYHLRFHAFKKSDAEYKQKHNIEKSTNRSVNPLTDLPEESSVFNSLIQDAFATLDKVDFRNMDKNQASFIAEKLAELKEKKMIEADQAGIHVYTTEFNELEDNKKNSQIYDSRVSVPSDNSIDDELLKAQEPIRKELHRTADIFTKWADVEIPQHPIYFKEARDEILKNLKAFNDFFLPTVDHKYRYSHMDWVEINFGWEDMSSFATERLYPKASIFCKKCREHDYELDPDEIKGLTTPVMMKPILNPNRTEKDPYPYIWQCPSCKGRDAIEVEITRERAQDNLKYARYKTYNIMNRFPLAVANIIYFHEWQQPYRLGETVKMTPKLENSK